jgi:hypothetical protein
VKERRASAVLLALGWIVACGSSDPSPTEEQANANFAGQGNRAGEKVCNTDVDCDNHDPCTTFRCERGNNEITVGHCVYALGNGDACRGALPDAGYIVTQVPDPDAGPSKPTKDDASAPADAGSVEDSGSSSSDAAPTACSKSVSVSFPRVATCTYNTTADSSSPATVSYPCAGGAASATFGAQTFTGTESDGSLSITNVSKYTFTNTKYHVTCTYVATQTITGTLASGKGSYSYGEALDADQPTLCPFVTAGCNASGDVTFQ